MGFLFAGESWRGWVVIVAFVGLVLQWLYWGFVTGVVVVLVVFRVVSIWFLMVRGFVAGVAGVLVLFRVLDSSGFGCWIGGFRADFGGCGNASWVFIAYLV